MTTLSDAKKWLAQADSIIVTAGTGFTRLEGLDILSEEKFDDDFGEIAVKYDVHTIGDALDRKLGSWGETWLFWSKLIEQYTNHYEPGQTMQDLKQVLQDKDYFVATNTFNHMFEKAGFNENRIFNLFGDWTKMQCSSGINHGLKDTAATVKAFLSADKDADLEKFVPKCEVCNSEMEIHMPLNSHFYPDTDANTRLRWFLTANEDKKVLILELGVDETSPQLLDPMASLVAQFENWHYLAADLENEDLPEAIAKRSFGLGKNSYELLKEIK